VSERKPPAEPKPASTILLLRDADDGRIEVFMEKRHLSSTFVGGAYVFPGGRVDEEHRVAGELRSPGAHRRAIDLLGSDDGPAHMVAALRETFEEAGVLLAYDADDRLLDFSDPEVEDRYREARDRLNAGDLQWPELLGRENLRLATDRLHYWSHWVTPVGEPRRYDTRFFVAEAPTGQTATHDDWELTSSVWVDPGTALDRALAGEWFIIFPTLHTLRRLEQLGSTAEALAWAAADHHRPVNQPRLLEGRPVLPGDEGYEDAEEDITGSDPAAWTATFRR